MGAADARPVEVSVQEMARFEAAIDTLNQHIGSCNARVYAEQAQPVPDPSVLDVVQPSATVGRTSI